MIRRILAIFSAISVIALGLAGAATASTADGDNDSPAAVHFLVDVSGSMSGSKLLEAKTSLLATSTALESSGIQVGLRSFSGSCGSPGSLLVPVGPFDSGTFEAAVNSLQAGGGTPTSAALRLAAADFPSSATDRTLILIADGDDGCGDLCVTAQTLVDEGVEVRIQAVGIQVGAGAEQSLSCAARATGGEYFAVSDLEDLSGVIGQAVNTGLVVSAQPTGWNFIDNGSIALVELLVAVENSDGTKASGALIEIDGRPPLPVGLDGRRTFSVPVDPLDDTAQVLASLGELSSSIEVDLYDVRLLLQCQAPVKRNSGAALGNLFGALLPGGTAVSTIKAYIDGIGGIQELKEDGGVAYTGGYQLEGRALPPLYVYSTGSRSGERLNVYSDDAALVGNLDPADLDSGSPLARLGRFSCVDPSGSGIA